MSFTVSELAGLQTSKYFNVAGTAILIFNYAITLDEEVRWMWGRSWDVTRIVFMVSRYSPFAGVGMTAYAALRTNSDPCGPSLAENIIHMLSIIASEVLLILRTYAFWQGSKPVLYGLLAYACVSIAAAATLNLLPVNLLPLEPNYPEGGCYMITSRGATFVYVVLLAFELVILFLTLYKRFSAYGGTGSSGIIHTLYRDGMFYILSIALITFANVLVDGIFAFQFSDLLDIPQITLHSVLASRIMFNLRKDCSSVQGDVDEGVKSDVQVVSDMVCQPGTTSTVHRVTLVSAFETQSVAGSISSLSVDLEAGRV